MEPFAFGASGAQLFRVEGEDGEPLVMKALSGPLAGELADEAKRLDWLGKRAPAPRVVTLGRAQDSCWFTMTRLPGVPGEALAPAVHPLAAAALAHALRTLHALPAAKCPFDQRLEAQLARAAQRVAEGWVDEGDFDDERRGQSAADVLRQALRERPATEEPVVTHGDCTLDNTLFHEDGRFSGFLDASRTGLADRHQDLALALRGIRASWGERAADAFVEAYGRDRFDAGRLRFYELLDEFF